MIDPSKKYRTRHGDEVAALVAHPSGGYSVLARRVVNGEVTTEYSYRVDANGASSVFTSVTAYDLIEVRPEVTVRGYVAIKGRDVSVTSDLTPAAGWIELGAIDITHDGEKLIKVEIVK